MMAIPRNEWQNSGGNLIYGHPGGSNTHILTKMTPNIGTIQIIALFGASDNAKYPKYTFRINHDGTMRNKSLCASTLGTFFH